MSMFGIKEAVVAIEMRQVAGDGLDLAGITDRFARAVWCGVAEPGDRVAGALVARLGAGPALSAVLAGPTGVSLARMMRPDGEEQDNDSAEWSADEFASALERWAPRLASAPALASLRQAVRFGARLLVPGDADWPLGVDDLGDGAPLALWVRGRTSVLETTTRSIAIVGARAATGYGEHVAMEASAGLVDRGYTIVSGGAYGIDGMAHRAALASSGLTVAFLAGGVDRFYPSGHEGLLTRISEAGAVVSEVPCGTAPTKWRFLQRNRLIAAAARATVVVEAGWRSGSLNTAGHAAAIGRPLGAVPGPVTSASSAGCHRLIRDFDAICVTNPDQMAELAPLEFGAPTRAGGEADVGTGDSSDTTRVVDALSIRSPRSADDIAARCGLATARVQSVLGSLELDGRVAPRGGGWVVVSVTR